MIKIMSSNYVKPCKFTNYVVPFSCSQFCRIPTQSHPTPDVNSVFPAREKTEPNSFLADDDHSFCSEDYKVIVVNLSKDNEVLKCGVENLYQTRVENGAGCARDDTSRDVLPGNSELSRDELSYVVEEAPELDDTMNELRVETMEVAKVAR